MLLSMSRQKIVGLTAPSGAGKSSIAQRVLDAFPGMHLAVSVTTRAPRPHEEHGKDYFFVSLPEFERLLAEGALLEYEEVYPGCFYGTPHFTSEEVNGPVLLDIDVKGAANVRAAIGGFFIFVAPPSEAELERRLRERGTETEQTLLTRLKRAKKELAYADQFDALVVNDSLDEAADEAISLIASYLQHE